MTHRCSPGARSFPQNSTKNIPTQPATFQKQRALVELRNAAAAGTAQHKALLVPVAKHTQFGNPAIANARGDQARHAADMQGSCRGGCEAPHPPFSCPMLLSPLTTVFATSVSSCSVRQTKQQITSGLKPLQPSSTSDYEGMPWVSTV